MLKNTKQLSLIILGDKQTKELEKALELYSVTSIQRACNNLGSRIVLDGIIGSLTLTTIKEIGLSNILESLNEYDTELSSTKETIMNYLYEAEGNTIHYLKGEKGFTAPFGIYSHAHPNSTPVNIVRKLYLKYGLLSSVRQHARKLDNKISTAERTLLTNAAWVFYSEKYLGKKTLRKILSNYPKSSLSIFSNNINSGNHGNVSLQKALGVKADGVIGPNTLGRLYNHLKTNSDTKFNQSMLTHMAAFYIFLVTKSKKRKHYRRFSTGWCNRLKGLLFRTTKNKCN